MRYLPLLLLLIAGCAADGSDLVRRPNEPPKKPQSADTEYVPDWHEIQIDGKTRRFAVCRPTHIGKPAPVIFGLHGRGGNGEAMIDGLGLRAMARQRGAIYIAPSADGGIWQDGASVFDPKENDLKFFNAMLDKVPEWGGDPSRVYAIGFSNGGEMAFRLACVLGNRFASTAGGGGSIGVIDENFDFQALPKPVRPISVFTMHGMKDNISGYGMDTFGVSAPDSLAWWARQLPPGEEKKEHQEFNGGSAVFDAITQGGETVCLLSLRDEGHSWPDTMELGGKAFNEFVWDFLYAHTLPAKYLK